MIDRTKRTMKKSDATGWDFRQNGLTPKPLYRQEMDIRTLIVVAALCALPGCVTETTYAGQNSTQREVGPDLKAAAQTRLDLGIQYLRQGNAEQAKFNLDRALQYDPNNPQVYIGFAYFYQQVSVSRPPRRATRKRWPWIRPMLTR